MPKSILLSIAGLLGLGVVGLGGYIWSILSSTPPKQGPRLEGDGFVGVETGGSYAWVVPTDTGVVLVDAGIDPDAEALKNEIGDRTVHAVLVTHGHPDHVWGLSHFPDATVHIGPGEGPIVRGEATADTIFAKVYDRFVNFEPHTPSDLRTFADGDELRIDGEVFTAIHTPGHTRGSAMYRWRSVIFTGDTLFGHGAHVEPGHPALAEDPDANRASVGKLLSFDFTQIADGHVGLHDTAREQVEAYARHQTAV